MKDRRNYGLQLVIINPATYEMEHYTPRNMNIARAMAETHAWMHQGTYFLYKVENYSPGHRGWPTWWDTKILEADTERSQ